MKYLAIDLGSRRIGLAVSDMKGIIAQPLSVITPKSDTEALGTIASLCTEKKIECLIIGIPFSASDTVQEKYRAFGKKISNQTGLPIHEWDETFTTKQAQNMVAFSDRPARKVTSRHRDDVAAAIILQEFLDNGIQS